MALRAAAVDVMGGSCAESLDDQSRAVVINARGSLDCAGVGFFKRGSVGLGEATGLGLRQVVLGRALVAADAPDKLALSEWGCWLGLSWLLVPLVRPAAWLG